MKKIIFLTLFTVFAVPILCSHPETEAAIVSPRQNEILSTGALRQLYVAQMTYKNGVGNGNFASLLTLFEEGLIDGQLAQGFKFGFNFSTEWTPGNGINPPKINIYAVPVIYPKTGRRSFAIDEMCRLRGSDNGGVGSAPDDPVLLECPYLNVDVPANEMRIIDSMSILYEAQVLYRNRYGNYGFFFQLAEAGLISWELAAGTSNYYNYSMSWISPSENNDGFFKIWATPVSYGVGGLRSFYVEKDDVIRGADHKGGEADENDPPVEMTGRIFTDLEQRKAYPPSRTDLPGVFRTGFERGPGYLF